MKVGNYQSGFKEGGGTQQNITKLLKEIAKSRVYKSQRKAHLFIDFKKAFDTVNRRKLAEILIGRAKNESERHCIKLLI